MILNNCRVEGNTTRSTGGTGTASQGGGIFNVSFGSTYTHIEIYNSLIANNTAATTLSASGGTGGGLGSSGLNTVLVVNSTISGNHSDDPGGGIARLSGGEITLNFVTITNNSASSGGGVSGTIGSIKNSIVAGNSAGANPDCSGTLNSDGYNLIGNTSGTTITGDLTGNILNVSAELAPLADNGGNTSTHALLPGSPAIDAGDCGAVAADQRGVARPQGSACDIGAFELVQNLPPLAICQDVTVAAGSNCEAEASIDNGSYDPDGDPVTITQDPPGPYPLGTTNVTLTVADNQGASSQCVATVTVNDSTAPAIACPADMVVDAAPGACEAVVEFEVSAMDNCDGPVAVVCNPPSGSAFPVGVTEVTCVATDNAGNSANCTFTVTVNGSGAAIAGTVSVNGTGVEGATVKLLDDEDPTIVIENLLTDSQGNYSFQDVPPGEYQVMLVEPLGYTVNQNFVVIDLTVCGASGAVDFVLTPIVMANDARGMGYWKHQFDVYVRNKGHAQESAADLENYIALVHQRYTPHFKIFAPETPPGSGIYDPLVSFEDWQAVLSVKGNAGMKAKATSHLAALALNLMSLKIAQYQVVTADGKTAGEVLTYVSELLEDGISSNDELAKNLAEKVNEQMSIAAGLVNPSQTILYKEGPGEAIAGAPGEFALYQNYPNPFNPATTIRFALPEAGRVSLKIYNTRGQVVRTLASGQYESGVHEIQWDARNDFGETVSSGVYFCHMQAGNFVENRKMVLLR